MPDLTRNMISEAIEQSLAHRSDTHYIDEDLYDGLMELGIRLPKNVEYRDELPDLGSHTHVRVTLEDLAEMKAQFPGEDLIAKALQEPQEILKDPNWRPG